MSKKPDTRIGVYIGDNKIADCVPYTISTESQVITSKMKATINEVERFNESVYYANNSVKGFAEAMRTINKMLIAMKTISAPKRISNTHYIRTIKKIYR